MKAPPRSEVFDDVYFSAQDGLAETKHVFLDGNALPAAWQDKTQFTIAETGFGTGLNFLSTWKLFEETTHAQQKLHFISVEKFPLKPKKIQTFLSPWSDFFSGHLEKLCDQYPLPVPGFHRLYLTKQVFLTLLFDDVNAALPGLEASIDAWFLDGFKPSANPEMWTETLFEEMARLSAPGASFATFTAAGSVRRGLQEAGFTVNKMPGFGSKREMLAGKYKEVP